MPGVRERGRELAGGREGGRARVGVARGRAHEEVPTGAAWSTVTQLRNCIDNSKAPG